MFLRSISSHDLYWEKKLLCKDGQEVSQEIKEIHVQHAYSVCLVHICNVIIHLSVDIDI